jgi:hypothetical protein
LFVLATRVFCVRPHHPIRIFTGAFVKWRKLITSPTIHSRYAAILDAVGDTILHAAYLSKGARCTVWKLRGSKRSFVLRVFKDQSAGLPVDADAALRRGLLSGGARVAEPVMTSADPAAPQIGRAWSLDVFQRGVAFNRDRATPLQMAELGVTLRRLHDLEPERFGVDGLQTAKVPFTIAFLEDSLMRAEGEMASKVAGEIRLAKSELWAALGEDKDYRPCHADIYEQQVLLNGGSALTLLDFSELCAAHWHWDLGAVLVMTGQQLFGSVAEGYGLTPDKHTTVLLSARFQALLTAISINRARSATARRYLTDLGR